MVVLVIPSLISLVLLFGSMTFQISSLHHENYKTIAKQHSFKLSLPNITLIGDIPSHLLDHINTENSTTNQQAQEQTVLLSHQTPSTTQATSSPSRFPYQCSTYLSISNLTQGIGRGVFAGKRVRSQEILDVDISILIPYEYIENIPQLHDYVYASDHDGIVFVALGLAGLLNSVDTGNHTVEYVSAPYHTLPRTAYDMVAPYGSPSHLPYVDYYDFIMRSKRVHQIDEEFFNFYGEDWYCRRRGLGKDGRTTPTIDVPPIVTLRRDPQQPSPTPSSQQSSYYQVCLKDVTVKWSTLNEKHSPLEKTPTTFSVAPKNIDTTSASNPVIPVGRGLFAKRAFKQGEAITVSPVAVLNKTLVDSWSTYSLLPNYCLWDGQADVVLLPMTTIMMMNHQPSWNGRSNVVIQWFSWLIGDTWEDAKQKIFTYGSDPKALVNSPICPLDIILYAARDIAAGEELFLDYGEEWENAWTRGKCHYADQSGCQQIGTFRSYVRVPNGFFPDTWSTTTTTTTTNP